MKAAELALEQVEMRERQAPAPPEQTVTIPHLPTPTEAPGVDRSKDVVVYVRHNNCKAKKDCECPRWLYDKFLQKRYSARTKFQQAAEEEAQRIMDSRDPVKRRLAELERKREYETIAITDAITKYLKDCEHRELSPETVEAYECALIQMKDFCHAQGVYALGEITPELLKDWRGVWPDKKKSAKAKKQRQIKTFFKFACEQMHWLDINANPALALTKIVGEEEVAAVPFYEDQYDAILDAFHVYEDSNRFRDAAKRLRGLIQLQRWSGLAIRDALTLPCWRIDAHGVLKVQRTKTKTWVTIPLPLQVVGELRELVAGNSNPEYFFWNGKSKPRTLVGDYNRMFRRLWKLVRWPRPVVDGDGEPVAPHSHMFRHTCAYHFLNTPNEEGVYGDIRHLQQLLGHKRLATTEKHYSGMLPDHAERLNKEVRSRFAGQNAPGVAKPAPQSEHHVRVPLRRRAHR